MSLRGRINQSVTDWRNTHANQPRRAHAGRTHWPDEDDTTADPRWCRFETLMDFIGFCCVVVIAASLDFVALCFLGAVYPATSCAALSIIGLCK